MAFEERYLKDGVQLFENQKHNVKQLIHRRRALLSDKVGSGKTLSCLYAFAYLKEKGFIDKIVVLTPLSAYEKEVWKKDVDKFTKLSCISIDEVMDHSLSLSDYDVVYGKHTHVKDDAVNDMLSRLCRSDKVLLIIDEVHAMKNPKADITKMCTTMSRVAKNFWGITGSTVSKNMEDLYHIVDLISPGYLGNFFHFREKYCVVRDKVIGWDPYKQQKRTAKEIVGVKDEVLLQEKLAPLMIVGESFSVVKFHWMDYEMDSVESSRYRKIAKGITLEADTEEDWLAYVLGHEEVDTTPRMKDVEAFSSRFIYLQSVVDGTLKDDGTLTGCEGTKIDMLLDKIGEITCKGQSCIVYFDYLASLHAVEKRLKDSSIWCDVLISSGEHVLEAGTVTEERVKKKPVVILGTRASSESVSYYMINHVIFFDIPSVPHTFVQLVGRITRKNTLYPDDLNVWIFRSNNIDLYKMLLVSNKSYQLEIAQGHEGNIPDDYKRLMSKAEMKDIAKKVLLWGTDKNNKDIFRIGE